MTKAKGSNHFSTKDMFFKTSPLRYALQKSEATSPNATACWWTVLLEGAVELACWWWCKGYTWGALHGCLCRVLLHAAAGYCYKSGLRALELVRWCRCRVVLPGWCFDQGAAVSGVRMRFGVDMLCHCRLPCRVLLLSDFSPKQQEA